MELLANTLITSATDLTYQMASVEKSISTSFYGASLELVKFNFEQSFNYRGFTLHDLHYIYKLAGIELDQPNPLATIKVISTSFDVITQALLNFSAYKGDPDHLDILEEFNAPWCKENFNFMAKVLSDALAEDHSQNGTLYFQVKTSYSVNQMKTRQAYFDPFTAWGFCFLIINPNTHFGLIFFADASF